MTRRRQQSPGGRVLGISLVLTCVFSIGAVRDGAEVDPVPALRKAREAQEAGDLEKALEALDRLQRGPLADHAELLRSQWLLEIGDIEGSRAAAQAAIALEPPSEILSQAYYELARGYLAQDDLTGAFQAQNEAWEASRDSDHAATLAFDFAHAFEEHGLPGDALQLHRRVWQTWPRSSVSGDAFERSIFLTEATGAPVPEPDSLTTYADGLRTAYLCDAALPVYDGVLDRPTLSKTTRKKAARGRADCLFQRRRYTEAHEAYGNIARKNPGDVDAAIRAARSDARGGKSTAAVKALTEIARTKRPAHQARAQYLIAIILNSSDPEASLRLFQRVEEQKAAPGLARLARWRMAWADVRASRHSDAIRRLEPLANGSIWDIEVQRARYWIAVATLESDAEAGQAGLTELAEKIPLSYYGLLSADRLGTPPQVGVSFVQSARDKGPFPPAQRAGWLQEAGFPGAARAELESWMLAGGLTRSQRVAAASQLHALGEHFKAVRVLIAGFGGTLEQGIDPSWEAAWQYAWPKPYELAVRKAVREFEFDPSLVYAIMREESTYRPRVESPAGARGLMQIIPPTGDQIATSLGVRPFASESLFEPDTNIRFGTWYLKHLLGEFDGKPQLAIAAYNAGPDAVNGWLRRDGPLPSDRFVDSVPYGETRRYLRRVLRSWRVYKLLYGDTEHAAATQPTGDSSR